MGEENPQIPPAYRNRRSTEAKDLWELPFPCSEVERAGSAPALRYNVVTFTRSRFDHRRFRLFVLAQTPLQPIYFVP